jgi:hypothetical protein
VPPVIPEAGGPRDSSAVPFAAAPPPAPPGASCPAWRVVSPGPDAPPRAAFRRGSTQVPTRFLLVPPGRPVPRPGVPSAPPPGPDAPPPTAPPHVPSRLFTFHRAYSYSRSPTTSSSPLQSFWASPSMTPSSGSATISTRALAPGRTRVHQRVSGRIKAWQGTSGRFGAFLGRSGVSGRHSAQCGPGRGGSAAMSARAHWGRYE